MKTTSLIAALEEALSFYADPDNYLVEEDDLGRPYPPEVMRDLGERASFVLNKLEEERGA